MVVKIQVQLFHPPNNKFGAAEDPRLPYKEHTNSQILLNNSSVTVHVFPRRDKVEVNP